MAKTSKEIFSAASKFQQNGQYDTALALYEEILNHEPRDFNALIEAAVCHYHLGDYALGRQKIGDAGKIRPDDFLVLKLMGVFAAETGDLAGSAEFYRRALEKNPQALDVLNNLGLLYKDTGEFQRAKDCLNAALKISPNDRHANNNLALVEFTHGDFRQGCLHYRFRIDARFENVYIPEFGEIAKTNDRLLYLVGEQGPGDELFFLRFVASLREKGIRVVYFGSPLVIPLLIKHPLFDSVHALNPEAIAKLPKVIRIGDLPLFCGVSRIEDIPPPLPIVENAAIRTDLATSLSKLGAPPYIGLTWRAGPVDAKRRVGKLSKNVSLETLADAIKNESGTFLALQRLPRKNELAEVESVIKKKIVDVSTLNERLDVMLALLALLDRYYAVSNTNVHLRSSLGKPCDVFVPYPPEWRWMDIDGNSPWFPNCHTIRQTGGNMWPTLR